MRDELRKRLDDIFSRYAMLDSAEWLLANNLGRIKAEAAKYGKEIDDFLYSLIDEKIINQATVGAAQAYAAAMASQIQSGALRKVVLDRRKLVDAIIQTWQTQADSVAKGLESTAYAKGAQFQALAVATEIPAERLREIGQNEIVATRLNGKLYRYVELDSIWKRMNNAYGQRDTIQYRNGVNYPLRSYVDARQVTSESETHRMATVIEASADGVWFGTTNKTGTTDSCLFHEGTIFFMTDEARAQAVAKYGNRPELATMRTWTEIVADRTHMGKFGCKHIVRPMPIQFYSEERALETISENKGTPIPKKINERKIYEEATGMKLEPAVSNTPSYKPIPPQSAAPDRYTYA